MWTFVDVIRYEAILSIPPEGTIHLDLDVGEKKKKKRKVPMAQCSLHNDTVKVSGSSEKP